MPKKKAKKTVSIKKQFEPIYSDLMDTLRGLSDGSITPSQSRKVVAEAKKKLAKIRIPSSPKGRKTRA